MTDMTNCIADDNNGLLRLLYPLETDTEGNPICYSKISINDGYLCAMAKDQDELGSRLDELVLMVLDYGLHSNSGKTTEICATDFYLN